MSLTEYRRKRNFRKTAEPKGGKSAEAAPGLRFVVQKHAASRLHYDFRLEYDGTLKSWAVPKGPHLDPAVKSLAVQVEDHPLEYADFEGIIPQGQYGGGTVMVWDRGIWEPEEDAARGFKSGKLKFTLHGEKLKGSWALVRMAGRSGDGGKNWLLIKHRDKAARPNAKSDFLARNARSVLSGRTMEQIAADADSVWSSNGKATTGKTAASSKSKSKPARKSSASGRGRKRRAVGGADVTKLPAARQVRLPAKFKPQLATLASDVPTGDGWLHELKFDGYRILSFVDGDAIRLVTRNGNDWTDRFPSIAKALAELPVKTAIFDGEVVSLDEAGRSDFQQLQNFLKRGDDKRLVYYAFDLPHYGGYDLTGVPLADRKQLLARVILPTNPKGGDAVNDGLIRYSDHIAGSGEDVLQHACRGALEGIVSKRADSKYQQSRSLAWLKVKCLQRQEFVIGGYSKPEGSRVGFGALLLGYHENGELKYAGRVGTGFSTQSLRDLTKELKKRAINEPPFFDPPTGAQRRGVTWVRPELVAEVEFTEWTDEGPLRHPSFQGLREDKPPSEIVREDIDMPVVKPRKGRRTAANSSTTKSRNTRQDKSRRRAANRDAEATVAGVRITHPDRVLYPEIGLTKLGLAEFYAAIADWVLPHVVDRPLTLVRCPEGRAGQCFYQKHLTDSLPDAVRGVMIQEKDKREEYVVIDDLAGLVSLVQMGVLELHPWPARADKVERPDRVVFDFDPGEGVAWSAVVEAAREIHDRLDALGLESFLRTSGGKGLHVVVPLVRRNSWDELKAFAKGIADQMVRDDPKRYIATMSKAKRRGKVFVDYLRNQRGATAIASYSTRARAGAPVATPLAWEELAPGLKADKYTVANLRNRLTSLAADPWKGFFSVRQSLTAKILSDLA